MNIIHSAAALIGTPVPPAYPRYYPIRPGGNEVHQNTDTEQGLELMFALNFM